LDPILHTTEYSPISNKPIYLYIASYGRSHEKFLEGLKKSHAPLLAAAVLPAARELVAP
jgi:hypothetical protein